MRNKLEAEGAMVSVIAPKLGVITAESGEEIPVDESFLTAASVLYDAVFVPGGVNSSATLEANADAVHFLNEAFRHCKAIATDASARQVIEATYFNKNVSKAQTKETALTDGVIISDDAGATFIKMIAMHRFWEREKPLKVPA